MLGKLRETTIASIRAEGVDMSTFGVDLGERGGVPECGTPRCAAGHIVTAALKLGAKLPELSELPTRDYGCPHDTPRLARYFWAQAYGKDEAARLGFYSEEWLGHNHDGSTAELKKITVDQVVAHLEGEATPYGHDGYDEDGFDAQGDERSEGEDE